MRTVKHCIDALRLVAGGNAVGIVVPVAGAGRDIDTVCLVSLDGDGGLSGVSQLVRASGATGRGEG